MQQRVDERVSGGQSDDELRVELERAVATAGRVIRGATLPLPFAAAEADGGGDASVEEEGVDGVSLLVN